MASSFEGVLPTYFSPCIQPILICTISRSRCFHHWHLGPGPYMPLSAARDSRSSGRKGYCAETVRLHPNNGHKYLGCNARSYTRRRRKPCLNCRPYRLCTTGPDHSGASLYDEHCKLGEIRGWGTSAEPLSVSQAAGWAEHSSVKWGSIFKDAVAHRTNFSETPDALPFHARIPEFNCYLDGKPSGDTLRASAVFEWEVRMSIAGLVTSHATTSSECIVAIHTPVLADFDNNYPEYPEGNTTSCLRTLSNPPRVSNHTHPTAIPVGTPNEPNYLGLLTLGWTYVLSAYWVESQQGIIRYSDRQACCNSSIAGCRPLGFNLHLNASHLGPNELRWWQAGLARLGCSHPSGRPNMAFSLDSRDQLENRICYCIDW